MNLQDIRRNLRHFDLLRDSDLSHSIVKRGADPTSTHKFNKIREVGFNALGREFRDDDGFHSQDYLNSQRFRIVKGLQWGIVPSCLCCSAALAVTFVAIEQCGQNINRT